MLCKSYVYVHISYSISHVSFLFMTTLDEILYQVNSFISNAHKKIWSITIKFKIFIDDI